MFIIYHWLHRIVKLLLYSFPGLPHSQPMPHPEKMDIITVVEGSRFNSSCGLTILATNLMYACVTKNTSATFNDFNDISELLLEKCVKCGQYDIGRNCAMQFNSSLTGITVSRQRTDGCPPSQLMNFVKENVSLDDNGTKIICAYGDGMRSFHSIYLSVSPSTNNHSPPVAVLSSVLSTLGLLSVVTTIVAVVYSVSRRTRRRQQSESVHRY